MKPAPISSQDCLCNDNQQMSGSDTKKLAFWLEEPIFTHWQLNAAALTVGDPQHLHFAVNKSVSRKTRNGVYKEIQ